MTLQLIDLNDQVQRRSLLLKLYEDAERASRELYCDAEPRTYLGASVVAGECSAKMWGDFRWFAPEEVTGQEGRLFNRGHLEEARFVKLLKQIGFEVREHDPETGEQFGLTGCNGHFGGHLDALAKPPASYGLPDWLVLLGEFKTHSEKSYTKLAGKKEMDGKWNLPLFRTGGSGLKIAKPTHYGQMCCYGLAYGTEWGLYVSVNKDTDELYFEFVKLDWNFADDLFRKADSIIRSKTQPPKVALNETYLLCKGCEQSAICHRGAQPQKNCRSCVFSEAIEDGKWRCANPESGFSELDKPRQKIGCSCWVSIINAN